MVLAEVFKHICYVACMSYKKSLAESDPVMEGTGASAAEVFETVKQAMKTGAASAAVAEVVHDIDDGVGGFQKATKTVGKLMYNKVKSWFC